MKYFNTSLEEQETLVNILYNEQKVRLYSNKVEIIQNLITQIGQPTKKYEKSKTYWSGASWDIDFTDFDKLKVILNKDAFLDDKFIEKIDKKKLLIQEKEKQQLQKKIEQELLKKEKEKLKKQKEREKVKEKKKREKEKQREKEKKKKLELKLKEKKEKEKEKVKAKQQEEKIKKTKKSDTTKKTKVTKGQISFI